MTIKNTGKPANGIWFRLYRTTHLLEDATLVLLLAGMVLIATSQILLRNFWDAGLAWGDPLLRVLVLWTGLLGAMAATRDDNHIRIDVLHRFLPPRAKRVSRIVTDLFTAVVCGIVAWYAGLLVMMEKEDGVILFAAVPAWVSELILPIAFTVMALRFLFSFILGMIGKKAGSGQHDGVGDA